MVILKNISYNRGNSLVKKKYELYVLEKMYQILKKPGSFVENSCKEIQKVNLKIIMHNCHRNRSEILTGY